MVTLTQGKADGGLCWVDAREDGKRRAMRFAQEVAWTQLGVMRGMRGESEV